MINSFFHYLSYSRFVAYAFGLYLSLSLFFRQTASIFDNLGLGLFLLGIGFSLEGFKFSDTYSKSEIKDYSKEKSAEISILICLFVLCIPILIGLFFLNVQLFFPDAHVDISVKFKELGYGSIAFGIGGITYFKDRYNRLKSFKKANTT
ncbi:MAG: hypothetical protein GY841_06210 [FCB group bacterium]|nr:hypothetical protein [FCB group bacterium]